MSSDQKIQENQEESSKLDSKKDPDPDENLIQSVTTNKDNEDVDVEDNGWILELETALLSDCDINVIRKMSNQQSIPNKLRYEFWQTCLGIKGRLKILEDIFDLPEQNLIRNDCKSLVEKLNNTNFEKLSIVSDLESIITNFSRLNHCPYDSENGWIELLETLIHLNIRRDELFKIFETIQLRYITKYYNCSRDDYQYHGDDNKNQNNSNDGQEIIKEDKLKNLIYMQPFHLLRLLLLYHDPELCNYFDTIKLTPEMFANTWFRSLFCSLCNHDVSLKLLDAYFIFSNPFMIFYLSLVMIINLKDELKTKQDRKEILQFLQKIPTSITESDINDMFFIAEQHFLKKTPVSVKEFQKLLFQVYPQSTTILNDDFFKIKDLSNLLCLPISVQELLQNCQQANNKDNKQQQNDLNYFVVDCRPPDQYNNGHLLTAFHLDCSLMLNDPSAFNTAVQALLASQKQAIDVKSLAGGEHLCFIGTGNEDNNNEDTNMDCYIPMVVSSFLQKHHKYVSLLMGGYKSLHNYILLNNLQKLLIDHNQKLCIYCLENKKSGNNLTTSQRPNFGSSNKENNNLDQNQINHRPQLNSSSTSIFFQKFQNVLKPKINEMKEKLVEYVVNPTVVASTSSASGSFMNHHHQQKQPIVKHVSSENLGKRYKGSKFSLDDDLQLDESLDEDNPTTSFLNNNNDDYTVDGDTGGGDEINIDEWKQKEQILGIFECSKINSDGSETPGFLSFNKTDLFIIKKLSSTSNSGDSGNDNLKGRIIVKRPLEMIYQITSKRKCPEIITFKYGHSSSSGSGSGTETNFMAKDSLILIEPFEVIRLIKQQVVLLLDQQQQQPQQSNDSK